MDDCTGPFCGFDCEYDSNLKGSGDCTNGSPEVPYTLLLKPIGDLTTLCTTNGACPLIEVGFGNMANPDCTEVIKLGEDSAGNDFPGVYPITKPVRDATLFPLCNSRATLNPEIVIRVCDPATLYPAASNTCSGYITDLTPAPVMIHTSCSQVLYQTQTFPSGQCYDGSNDSNCNQYTYGTGVGSGDVKCNPLKTSGEDDIYEITGYCNAKSNGGKFDQFFCQENGCKFDPPGTGPAFEP